MKTETLQIEVELNGETRSVAIDRSNPRGCWHAQDTTLVGQFSTGTKHHLMKRPEVVQRGARWAFAATMWRRSTIYPVRWATAEDEGSGWRYCG